MSWAIFFGAKIRVHFSKSALVYSLFSLLFIGLYSCFPATENVNQASYKNLNPSDVFGSEAGCIDTTFRVGEGFEGEVTAILSASDGSVYIGGTLRKYKGLACGNLIKLSADGERDLAFDAAIGEGPNAAVFSITETTEGAILVTGDFTAFNNLAYVRAIRLFKDGSIDGGFGPGLGFNAAVYGMVIQQTGQYIFYGAFTQYNNVNLRYWVATFPNGNFDDGFNLSQSPTLPIWTAELDNQDRVWLGGQFRSMGDIGTGSVARTQNKGLLDSLFTSRGAGPNLRTLAIVPIENGGAIVGGDFISYAGRRVGGINLIDQAGETAGPFNNLPAAHNSGGQQAKIYTFCRVGNQILVGGDFKHFHDYNANGLIAISTQGDVDATFKIGMGLQGYANTIKEQHGKNRVLVGGSFSTIHGQRISGLVALRINK